ncbi:hypothetical protein Y032_0603g535 [Ancylostoma ceylanicum]|uniref:Uncharacterized protein n=1 Tax=Ancylostoma ceylanicum TaxID=53326 RepID=A0A016WLY4_9BILA|nr:hypothetical protein Y032_0603g535 [Ancylostoma ceylanicum]
MGTCDLWFTSSRLRGIPWPSMAVQCSSKTDRRRQGANKNKLTCYTKAMFTTTLSDLWNNVFCSIHILVDKDIWVSLGPRIGM